MRNFQDTFETRKRSFISAFSICMTVPLNVSLGNEFDKKSSNSLLLYFSKYFSKYSIKRHVYSLSSLNAYTFSCRVLFQSTPP